MSSITDISGRAFYMSYFLCCQENIIHSEGKRRGYAERDVKERKDERLNSSK
jgi:hypothetical protein